MLLELLDSPVVGWTGRLSGLLTLAVLLTLEVLTTGEEVPAFAEGDCR